jgi:hypothetical protein
MLMPEPNPALSPDVFDAALERTYDYAVEAILGEAAVEDPAAVIAAAPRPSYRVVADPIAYALFGFILYRIDNGLSVASIACAVLAVWALCAPALGTWAVEKRAVARAAKNTSVRENQQACVRALNNLVYYGKAVRYGDHSGKTPDAPIAERMAALEAAADKLLACWAPRHWTGLSSAMTRAVLRCEEEGKQRVAAESWGANAPSVGYYPGSIPERTLRPEITAFAEVHETTEKPDWRPEREFAEALAEKDEHSEFGDFPETPLGRAIKAVDKAILNALMLRAIDRARARAAK